MWHHISDQGKLRLGWMSRTGARSRSTWPPASTTRRRWWRGLKRPPARSRCLEKALTFRYKSVLLLGGVFPALPSKDSRFFIYAKVVFIWYNTNSTRVYFPLTNRSFPSQFENRRTTTIKTYRFWSPYKIYFQRSFDIKVSSKRSVWMLMILYHSRPEPLWPREPGTREGHPSLKHPTPDLCFR